MSYFFTALLASIAWLPQAKPTPDPCGRGSSGPADTTVYFVDQVTTKPEMISREPLRYPDGPRKQGVQGRVLLAITINAKGRVERNSVRVVQSLHPVLDREAVRYAGAAIFTPACRDGRPVRVEIAFPIEFGQGGPAPLPEQHSTRLADARGQLARRNLDSAVIMLRDIATDPRANSTARAEAFMWLGVAVYYQGQDSSTRHNFREALRHDPLLVGAEPLTRLDSTLGDWWEREQTFALCGEALPAWGWPVVFPSSSPMNPDARAMKPPELSRRPRLEYPSNLRSASTQGRVLARAILDTSGRAEQGSVRILSSPHPDFSRVVRKMIEGAGFSAAVSGGTAVRSCVILPVDFSIRY
jgi:TonB family protein